MSGTVCCHKFDPIQRELGIQKRNVFCPYQLKYFFWLTLAMPVFRPILMTTGMRLEHLVQVIRDLRLMLLIIAQVLYQVVLVIILESMNMTKMP